ncbi:MAG: DNA-directed RNA polymerase subunit P [Pyrodictiaceae archaeon]
MAHLYVTRNASRPEEGGLERIEDKALIRYRCGRCGAEFTALDLEYMPSIKCPYCGYRVVYKVRPPGSKIVPAI